MGISCDKCAGDVKYLGEDDNYYYYQCKDCQNNMKKKKLVKGKDYE